MKRVFFPFVGVLLGALLAGSTTSIATEVHTIVFDGANGQPVQGSRCGVLLEQADVDHVIALLVCGEQ